MRIGPDHIAAARSNLLRYDAEVGVSDLAAARIAIAPRRHSNARDLLLGFDKDLMALGHGATDLDQIVDGLRNTFEGFLKGRIRYGRNIADLDEFGLKFGQFDQGGLDQVLDRTGMDSYFVDGIPDCLFAHVCSFPGAL